MFILWAWFHCFRKYCSICMLTELVQVDAEVMHWKKICWLCSTLLGIYAARCSLEQNILTALVQHCCPSVPTPTCSRCILCHHSPPSFCAVFTSPICWGPENSVFGILNSHCLWQAPSTLAPSVVVISQIPSKLPIQWTFVTCLTSASTWISLVSQKMKAVGCSEILELTKLTAWWWNQKMNPIYKKKTKTKN